MRDLARFRDETRGLSAGELISWSLDQFGDGVVCASSMGAEDQVITHLIADRAPDVCIFTLDTGRLFPQTYDLVESTRARYGLHLHLVFPDAAEVEEMVRTEGPNLFYRSIEARKRCCGVRKVNPLKRALAGKTAWITGLRKSQASSRKGALQVDWDENNAMYKISPLVEWSESDVWDFIRKNNVPYHPLHDQGFPSIGCAPCTRAVKPGADLRSGRWWWEQPDGKECGLHPGRGNGESVTAASRFGIGTLGTE
jgi:phosphoadenosine phosphosulfate reductase